MKRVYWSDTYLFNHTTKITAISEDEHGYYLNLEETIFHPQGGGQPSDEGTINGIRVTKLKDIRDINEINHYVDDISSFKVGDTVSLAIDKDKRLEYAALHTAGHVTSGVLRTAYHYQNQVGASHFPSQAKVEYELEEKMEKNELDDKIRNVIASGTRVTEEYTADNVRCIRVDGLCVDSCSGTHLNNTSEIAEFSVRKIETRKGRLIVGYDAKYEINSK